MDDTKAKRTGDIGAFSLNPLFKHRCFATFGESASEYIIIVRGKNLFYKRFLLVKPFFIPNEEVRMMKRMGTSVSNTSLHSSLTKQDYERINLLHVE